jgi:hypothetical protein
VAVEDLKVAQVDNAEHVAISVPTVDEVLPVAVAQDPTPQRHECRTCLRFGPPVVFPLTHLSILLNERHRDVSYFHRSLSARYIMRTRPCTLFDQHILHFADDNNHIKVQCY